eukprot:TRINITY_DN20886_c0_g1_i1.p1 TRINITY_DN20886_c0_g1~~TRINITY_DN20886_c0_g1_i1.p1  ORF type:complete len:328 (+),score=82.67 TRINITY_DN20886_c0_g1_i1:64-1047(+)
MCIRDSVKTDCIFCCCLYFLKIRFSFFTFIKLSLPFLYKKNTAYVLGAYFHIKAHVMSKNTAIEIFLRVRPNKRPYAGFNLLQDEQKAEFFIPKDRTQGYVNNQKEKFVFDFNQVFGPKATQSEIFQYIAKEVVDSGLEGFNGTIFAYGQTGSGKTFTMTGGPERYEDRGIIPRTISYVFSETAKRKDCFFEISISYLEIYNDDGYDLLDENHTTKNLSDLPKVQPRETANGQIILNGLSMHKAQNEEDALNLLFIGDTNRVVSETPKNDASTRSHCIFMIQLEAKRAGSDVKTISRVHLVDLSGSCLLYTSPSPRDGLLSRMPSSA